MSRDMQIFLCTVPYLFALAIGFSYIPPGLDEVKRLNTEIETVRGEYQKLSDRLKEKEALAEEQRKLDKDIQKVRAAVPPSAQMDILMIDLEKISDLSGVDLIAIEQPAADKGKEKKGSVMDSIVAEMGGKGLGAPQAAEKPAIAPNAPGQKAPVKPKEEDSDTLGIQRIERRVFVAGEYSQLLDFLKKLEAYQRIVGIQDLQISAPPSKDSETAKTPAGERAQAMELQKPVMTFIMNVYYLPGLKTPLGTK